MKESSVKIDQLPLPERTYEVYRDTNGHYFVASKVANRYGEVTSFCSATYTTPTEAVVDALSRSDLLQSI
jgi:hypothetical protein